MEHFYVSYKAGHQSSMANRWSQENIIPDINKYMSAWMAFNFGVPMLFYFYTKKYTQVSFKTYKDYIEIVLQNLFVYFA